MWPYDAYSSVGTPSEPASGSFEALHLLSTQILIKSRTLPNTTRACDQQQREGDVAKHVEQGVGLLLGFQIQEVGSTAQDAGSALV